MEELFSIPDFQPLPLPAPAWLLKAFLVIGFYLHAIPMNVALTGGLTAAAFVFYGKSKKHDYSKRLGESLAKSLPVFVSVAITQGIVPLLFIQLVYGPLFYTSSVIMAIPWIMIIILLLIAYYAYYFFSYKQDVLLKHRLYILTAAGILFLVIAFIFTNNTTLMLTPERWADMYYKNPYGFNLNLHESQVMPRYIHFVIAAVAVTALVIGCFGIYWYKRDELYSKWLIQTGSGLFILATLLQIPVGIWFLISLPKAAMWNFIGAESYGTSVFLLSMSMDIIALTTMAVAWKNGSQQFFKIGLSAALMVIFLMVIMRHLLREYYVQGFFATGHINVDVQWVLLILFLGSFVIGVFYIGWLIKIVWRAFHQPSMPFYKQQAGE